MGLPAQSIPGVWQEFSKTEGVARGFAPCGATWARLPRTSRWPDELQDRHFGKPGRGQGAGRQAGATQGLLPRLAACARPRHGRRPDRPDDGQGCRWSTARRSCSRMQATTDRTGRARPAEPADRCWARGRRKGLPWLEAPPGCSRHVRGHRGQQPRHPRATYFEFLRTKVRPRTRPGHRRDEPGGARADGYARENWPTWMRGRAAG